MTRNPFHFPYQIYRSTEYPTGGTTMKIHYQPMFNSRRPSLWGLTLGCLLTLAPFQAAAQDDAPAEGTADAQPAAPGIAPEALQEGQAKFEAATALFNAEKFDTALSMYEEALDILTGYEKRYVIHYNIGKCHEALGRFESAAVAYQAYLDEAGPDAGDRAEVEAALQALNEKANAVSEQFKEGKSHVEMAQKFFDGKDYSAALAEFEKAYDLLEGHPMRAFVFYNVGRCYEMLFQYTKALEYYKRYLDEAGEDAEDRKTVEATLTALEGLLGTLEIAVNTDAEVWIDNRMVGKAPGTVLVPGGRHAVELRADGYELEKTEIQITAREAQQLSFELSEISDYKGLQKGLFWTSAGLSLACLGTGIGFGAAAIKNDRDGQDADPNLNQENLTDKIEKLSFTADIFYGAAAVFAVTSTILFFLTDWDSERADTSDQTAKSMITPTFGANSAGIMWQGRF